MSTQPLENTPIPQSNIPPIHRLPTEILRYIFSSFLLVQAPSDHREEIVLSWVCQRWRHVITDDALLWTTINFDDNAELVATFIQWSKEERLRVELWDDIFNHPEKLALLKSSLISQAHRIETIQSALSSFKLEFIVDDVLRQPFPSLRHLAFIADFQDEVPLIDDKMPFTLDIGKLEIFEIYDVSYVAFDYLSPITSKVRKLDIDLEREDVDLEREKMALWFFSDKRSFEQLEVLSIRFAVGLPKLTLRTFPNLTALILEGDMISSIVGYLRLPNLRRLSMYDYRGYTLTFHPDFDYASIRYVSIVTRYQPASFTFHLVGSTMEKDIPDCNLWNEALSFSDSSQVKRFHFRTHFHRESTGFHNSLQALNDLLPKMPGVREISLPYMLRKLLAPPELHLSSLISQYTLLSNFRLIRNIPDGQVFGP